MGNKFFDIQKRINPGPPPLPEFLVPKVTDSPRIIKRKKGLSFLLYFGVLAFGVSFAVLVARAGYTNFYPEECFGTWDNSAVLNENLQNLDILESGYFDESNSAVLKKQKDKEIICHNFKTGGNSGRLLKLKLNVVWNFRSDEPTVENQPEEIIPIEQVTDPATTEIIEGNEIPQDESVVSDPISNESEPQVEESSPLPPPELAPETQPETLPISGQEQIPTESTEISFFRLVSTAKAQEIGEKPAITASLVFNGIEHFLKIEYSFDGGQTWNTIDNAELAIPADNLSEIENLQVRIVSLKEGSNLPNIYMKGMYLEAKFIPEEANENSDVSAIEEVDDSNPSLIESISETISEAVGKIAEVVIPNSTDNTPKITEGRQIALKVEWNFTVKQTENNESSGFLGSIKDVFMTTKEDGSKIANNYTLSLSSDAKTLSVFGNCSKKYYTILIFSSPNDYSIDPSRALINRAGVCNSGKFEFAIGTGILPDSTQNGKYYLVVGEQAEGSKVETTNEPQEIEIRRSI